MRTCISILLPKSLLVAVVLTWAGAAAAQVGDDNDLRGTEDATVITSEKLTFDYRKNYAVFEEDVVVTDPRLELMADKLAVWFNQDGDIQLIKAEGRVHITQEDKVATSGEAVYDLTTEKITLTKGPRLQRGPHYIEGQTITFWRNQELLKVEPQARAVFYPDADDSRLNFL